MRGEANGGGILGIHDDSAYGQDRAGLNRLPAGIGKQGRAQALAPGPCGLDLG